MPERSRDNRRKLTAKQERVACLLAPGSKKSVACRQTKTGESTLYEWMHDDLFRSRIEELRAELVDRSLGRLAEAMGGEAMDTLLGLLASESEGLRLDSVKTFFELFVN